MLAHVNLACFLKSLNNFESVILISRSKIRMGASLVAQWLRVHLLMQGTWV